jgi:magnesium-protoporphyrin O-methyltransferase
MAGEPRPSPDRESTPVCAGGACCVGNEFGERAVRRDVARYREKGPDETTRWLIDGLAAGGVDGLTVLDIGAGVGAVHLALLDQGASSAVDVDGSPAFVTAAAVEAARRGVADRVERIVGDFVELADGIEPADVVALDRVVCCYPHMDRLVDVSAARARLRYGLVYPRDGAWLRLGGVVFNAVNRLFRQRLRMYIHRTAAVEAVLANAGFVRRSRRTTLIWQVVIFERA